MWFSYNFSRNTRSKIRNDRGLESWTAAAILSLIGLFNIFGSLLSGYLSTKISKKIILSSIYALRGISIILFIFLPASNINAFIFGASFGFYGFQQYQQQVG